MEHNEPTPEFMELVGRLGEGDLTPEGAERIEQIASADSKALSYYVQYMDLHGTLRRYASEGANAEKSLRAEIQDSGIRPGAKESVPAPVHSGTTVGGQSPHAVDAVLWRDG
jgi:hypothetical protein